MDEGLRNKLLIGTGLVAAVVLIWWSMSDPKQAPATAPEASASPPAASATTPAPPAEAPMPAARVVAEPATRGAPQRQRGRPLVVVEVAAPEGAPADGPLVFGLHGRGDTAQGFSRVAGSLGRGLAWRFLGAPLPWQSGKAWFSDHRRAVPEHEIDAAISAIDDQVRGAGKRPLAMVGFSQGCMILLRYLALHPHIIRAGVCIGGAAVGELPTPGDAPTTPILFVHGAGDRVVAASAAREAIQAMENRGFATEFIEHAGGHVLPSEELPRISDWLTGRLAIDQSATNPRD